MSEEDILASPVLNHPLTQYMFSAPDEGAAAVVLCRADQAHRYTDTPIHVKATAIRPRNYGAYEVNTTWAAVDEDVSPTVYASKAAYEEAGIGPDDVDVIQLQDTDAGAEVIHLAENGFCADGDQEQLRRGREPPDRRTDAGERDGGLIANGEPIGTSGLRQIHELVLQPPRARRTNSRFRATRPSATPRSTAPRHRGRHDPVTLRPPWPTPRPRTPAPQAAARQPRPPAGGDPRQWRGPDLRGARRAVVPGRQPAAPRRL